MAETLNLPAYDVRLSDEGGRRRIFDVLRRRYVALTPEEWVRQHFVHFLMELRLGDKSLRCDTLLYGKAMTPRMIIEYKAPHIKIQQKTFDQVVAYNLLLKVDYLVVTNGLEHYCCRMDYERSSYEFLKDIPAYGEL